MSIAPPIGEGLLRETLEAERESLGIRGDMRIRWLYNPGNFSNAHYRVSGDSGDLHVKLVDDPTSMDHWYRLRGRLMRDYRAPEILARLSIPQAKLTAYVFPQLPGRAPDPALAGPVIREVGALLARLHSDDDLGAELPGDVTLLSSFQAGLLECLSEDLVAIRAHPEVSRHYDASTMAWLAAEAAALHEEARRRIPDEPVHSPIHSDPWIANLLVDGRDWRLLDWDGLRLGDPAGDWAMLLFDAWVHGADLEEFLPPDPDLRDRVRLHLRAAGFDSIVDPLSDLTEMPPDVPDAGAICAAKRHASQSALLRYRRLYV